MSRIFALDELGTSRGRVIPTRPIREIPDIDIDLDIDDLSDSDVEDKKEQETQLQVGEVYNSYETLKRTLINEEFSPEILEFQDRAINNLDKLIQEQNAISSEMLLIRERKPFGMLLFSDIDRIKYIMEKYLLCRRVKIENQVLSILSSPIYKGRLSEAELRHAEDYKKLLEDYLKAELGNKLPEDCLEDGVIKTFEKRPDLSKPVFCRVIKPLVPKDSQDTNLKHEPGDVIMDKYMYMRDALEDKSVELI
ncbi:hypothetical protein RhiirA5_448363 [Rhizophagus irregularis]|uniref:DNA replication complex GINS protein SLD5 n=3 Tax=Rhizophagus irregularis TaxID=588596 RepID=A0A2I1EAP6_9GLOM|nr:hypothetical protein GLOIN_2v1488363 [Rhizophagus irregularis DAOM 181602=DAOM 197198]EXX61982.1 hypothetical protein RirG_166130 [Rhizophagus irregularis DAOM 197198w]PKC18013.1 hypothetical protein RhiirA5_448363 [Rhizophagus irregularis]PKK78000.1 hypothetical protein RhiirC2_843845 [Rhizophagus irregularis]PKY19200.1 hypothetical protein RhiirB3_493876 [Rhizophagus irregularis]PKY38706.1 hypothetical protein RhiirA4_516096 [Rhizophagus irregularis]|eukprot:XP_025165611.1 hypothetical protein GLOIN_2v1488363 [Rhizophagus irregularis DAOM 181602=DAOM 197198]